jgi:(Z)-2-((N-methylformamido)methylene)-5-hydroxybutyrolactone dehydrogenase
MSLARFNQYIDGGFSEAAEMFESIDPVTEKPWALMPAASAADVDRAVSAAHRALQEPAWADFTPTARGKLLVKLGDLIAEHAGKLAELETRDTGKIIRETRAQIGYVADYYRYFGGLADKLQGAHLPVDKADMDVTLRREPIGVVAAIVPWNSQLFLSAVKLGPALAAGCTVVLKASEDGPAPLLEFARLVDKAGFPKGVVNVLTGFGDPCGKALTSHPLVARVAFTGGPNTARHVVRNTAENFAHTTLELGGKSPVLVFADADLESASNAIVAGIFAASGQSCVAGSRLYVEQSIHGRLIEVLKNKAERIVIGDPQDPKTEMGPLATRRQRDGIERVLERSVAEGAKLATGGRRPQGRSAGFFFEPTIVLAKNNAIPCMAEELFGPVLSVSSFHDEGEAIAKANDSQFGLASGLFTRDLSRAHRVIRKLHAGIVWVNTYRAVSPIVPFGGYGESGLGREGGLESILEYSRTKSVWVRTSDDPIPDPFVMR